MTDEYKAAKQALRDAIRQTIVHSLTERMAKDELTPAMLSEFAGLNPTQVSRVPASEPCSQRDYVMPRREGFEVFA